jgi:hypothetical protein
MIVNSVSIAVGDKKGLNIDEMYPVEELPYLVIAVNGSLHLSKIEDSASDLKIELNSVYILPPNSKITGIKISDDSYMFLNLRMTEDFVIVL